MSLSWANQFAKTALKTAQQKIDSVLDIRPGDEVPSSAAEPAVSSESLETAVALLDTSNEVAPAPSTSSAVGEGWTNAWNSLSSDRELIVDSEPNPIRDECPQASATLFDHSPSSVRQVPHHKILFVDRICIEISNVEDSVYVDVDLSVPSPDENQFASSSETIQEENALPPLPDIVLRNSYQDDSFTVASSDIEVIRNVDACSIASSRPTTDHMPFPFSTSKSDSTESFRAQLLHAEQRRNELKAANDTLQSNNAQLQQRIVVLNQQHVSLKKELDAKKAELEDLLAEGKRLSDHSGKQAREIRRLRSELTELEKIKTERKRMIKQLEGNVEHLTKEQSMRAATSEVAQKHVLEQNKLVADLERQLDEAHRQIDDLTQFNRKLTKETELMQSVNWSERLAGERANETAATVSAELQEARAHIQRLNSQLESTESRLEFVLNERNSVAQSISQANMPLLEEISNLKQALHHEQRASEEADVKMRTNKKELQLESPPDSLAFVRIYGNVYIAMFMMPIEIL
ncbi:unnamed protein product [Strongylus vulgaris]|uniref:TATA element modulatory factor 1 TATA binding domain-containing protein n=1 Tax=Strongylus vulgaris TaxID=40348 RepID=A0A3P7L704_STRVU|nr:unnamed protein product [Strongylus vulgaris]